jgi:hypothetical protein
MNPDVQICFCRMCGGPHGNDLMSAGGLAPIERGGAATSAQYQAVRNMIFSRRLEVVHKHGTMAMGP